ncbi:MAG: PQQ-dependent sugar dehydrogenase, partial [Galactobacter sp.]
RDSGKILEVVGDETREVGVVPSVVAGGEGGLLGLAVDGDDLFAYSGGPDGNRIQRFGLSGSPGSLAIGEPTTILENIPQSSNHNGGRIAFGPDGMLYATVGDAGERDAAQDRESLGGSIVRITRDGQVPSDNPFDDSPVYSYGHRNPQGLAWSQDGTMYAAEFGQDTWDELNIIEAGRNYGWPEVEGRGGGDEFQDPVAQWGTDVASPSAIAIQGEHLYVANLGGESLTRLDLSDPQDTEIVTNTVGRVREATISPDGELLILTNNTDGRGTPGDDDDKLIRVSD